MKIKIHSTMGRANWIGAQYDQRGKLWLSRVVVGNLTVCLCQATTQETAEANASKIAYGWNIMEASAERLGRRGKAGEVCA